MAILSYMIHARRRVLERVDEKDLNRWAHQACVAAEASPGWKPGEEFIYEIEESALPGVEWSAFTVRHTGVTYELFFYDGVMAETISEHCSWDPSAPPAGRA
jgi:hypothetical protein